MRQRGFEPLIISVPDSSKLFGFHKALMLADIDSWNFSWIFFGCFAPLCLLCGALALIDIQRGIIPNGLNLSIAGLGLLKAAVGGGVFAALEAGSEGVVIGLVFWLLRRLYFVLRKTQGLGLGDVKFLAAAGPWIGIAGLPTLLLVATLTALVAAGGLQLAGHNMTRRTSLPFGPFLAAGLLVTVILQQYLGAL
jgi:leader peptidase (prepilin peptidase) / N-methyltransferase